MNIIDRMAESMAGRAGLAWALMPDGHDMVCGHGMPEGCKDYWRQLARTGIVALREPTVEMLVAAQEEWMCVRAAEERGDFIWRAMIDAALTLSPAQLGGKE